MRLCPNRLLSEAGRNTFVRCQSVIPAMLSKPYDSRDLTRANRKEALFTACRTDDEHRWDYMCSPVDHGKKVVLSSWQTKLSLAFCKPSSMGWNQFNMFPYWKAGITVMILEPPNWGVNKSQYKDKLNRPSKSIWSISILAAIKSKLPGPSWK